MLNNIFIRNAITGDAQDISILAQQTFTESFGQNHSPKELKKYLHQTFNIEKITKSIDKPNNYYLLALIDSIPAGYLKLKLDLNFKNLNFSKQAQLQKIYVLKKYIGNQIGTKLLNESIRYLEERNFEILWLDVLQRNEAGIRFYKRHGFEKLDIYIHKFENSEATFDVMVKKLEG